MADTIQDDQEAPIVVVGADDQGNPVPGAALSGVTFTSGDPTIFTIGTVPDPTNPTGPPLPALITTGKLGTAQLNASALLPDGVTTITGSDMVTVVASGLATISISLGAATKRA